jgi:hypothetical protein
MRGKYVLHTVSSIIIDYFNYKQYIWFTSAAFKM